MIELAPIVGTVKIHRFNKVMPEGGPKPPSTSFQDFIYKFHAWIQKDYCMDRKG